MYNQQRIILEEKMGGAWYDGSSAWTDKEDIKSKTPKWIFIGTFIKTEIV